MHGILDVGPRSAPKRRSESPLGKSISHTYIPDRLRGLAAAIFHPRDFSPSAPLRVSVPARTRGEQDAASPSSSLHRHPQRARQRRLHRGRGSGRSGCLDAVARTRLDCLPAAARTRTTFVGRDRHRLDAPRCVIPIQEFSEGIHAGRQRRWIAVTEAE